MDVYAIYFPQHVLDGHPIEDARELCFPGQTLMPGMIECHNHLCIDATLPDHLELLEWSSECQLTILALKGLGGKPPKRGHHRPMHGR